MRYSAWRAAKRIASSPSLANAFRADSSESLFAMSWTLVEPDVASKSVILIHPSVAGKVGFIVSIKSILFPFEDWRLEISYWILENHHISRLINRQAKL